MCISGGLQKRYWYSIQQKNIKIVFSNVCLTRVVFKSLIFTIHFFLFKPGNIKIVRVDRNCSVVNNYFIVLLIYFDACLESWKIFKCNNVLFQQKYY